MCGARKRNTRYTRGMKVERRFLRGAGYRVGSRTEEMKVWGKINKHKC